MNVENKLCSACGQSLTQAPWNASVDLLFCVNKNCSKWHQPVGRIAKLPVPAFRG